MLLYVFQPADENRKGKVVVELDFSSKVGTQRKPITSNAVRTAGYVNPGDLRDPRYALLDRGLDNE